MSEEYIQSDFFNILENKGNKNENNFKGDCKKRFMFSYSKMSMYSECPLKYKFKYEDKIPEKPKFFFSFGQAIHAALEFFHSIVPPPSIDELIETFNVEWNKKNYLEKGYLSKEREEQDYNKGLSILRNYYDKHHKEDKIPFLLEYSTDVEVDGVLVRIVADKIEYLGEGRIRIVDYKTGKPNNRTPEQLYLYQKICEMDRNLIEKVKEKRREEVESIMVDSMLYYYVENLKEKVYSRASEDEINAFWHKAMNVVKNIENKKFDPTPGEYQCAYCDYKDICPIFSKKSKNNELSEDYIKEYMENISKIRELEKRQEEIEKKIFEYEGDEINFKGENASLKLKKKFRYEFNDREKLIDLLKRFGLYERVLKPTIAGINELLNDPEISNEVKTEIKRLGVRKKYLDKQIEDL